MPKSARAGIETLRAEAEKSRAETKGAQAEFNMARAEAETARAEAETARADAEAARADAARCSSAADAAESRAAVVLDGLRCHVEAVRDAVRSESKTRDGVVNLDALLKAAEVNDLKTAVEGGRTRLTFAQSEAAVLRCSGDVAAKKLGAVDQEAARKLLSARQKQLSKVKEDLDEQLMALRQRALKASVENAGRLRELLAGAKQKHRSARETRDNTVEELLKFSAAATCTADAQA